MAREFMRIKSAATTKKGIENAIRKESDFLDSMSAEEVDEYLTLAIAEGSIEATGKEIIFYEL